MEKKPEAPKVPPKVDKAIPKATTPAKNEKKVIVRVATNARLNTRAMGLAGAPMYKWTGPFRTLHLSPDEWAALKATLPDTAYRVIK